MARKIEDIKKVKQNNPIKIGENIRNKEEKDESEIKLYKQKSPIKEVKDLEKKKKYNYLYLKGKKFIFPKHAGNLLKIAIIGFLIIFIANVINVYYLGKSIEKEISDSAHEGYSYLLDAGKNATKIQFEKAKSAFDNATLNFQEAENSLWFLNSDTSFYAKSEEMTQAIESLLEGGKHFATAGTYFLEALEHFNKIPLYFVNKNSETFDEKPSITDTLILGLEKTNLAIEEISSATQKIENINESILPPEIKSKVIYAKIKIHEIDQILAETSKHFPAILKLLGDRHPHRYLILFQNNNEIRPTGGFIGSYAILDINDGYIQKLETYDVYDIDGSYGMFIEPPEEFKTFTPVWRFRDSNYSPDFPTSAQKAEWFLEKEGGPSVDTVIAINQGLLKDMLEITGPIQVGNFGKLNSENYNILLSFIIEGKIWGDEDPKHILKVFVPAFKQAIMKEENISKVSTKLYRAIQQKHIMFYSGDEDIQALFDSLGLSGRMYLNDENEDYLSVINISTGGTKSEHFIEEKILHESHIDKNGYVTDELTVTRSHLWDDSVYNKWKAILSSYGFNEMPDYLIDILGRGRNRVSMRIYVPKGAKVVDTNAEDMVTKFDKDVNKTYFFTEVEIKDGESKEVYVKYQLPFKLDFKDPAATYKLFADKQPGSRGSIFTKTITYDKELENLAVYPQETRIDGMSRIIFATDLVYDRYFSALFTK